MTAIRSFDISSANGYLKAGNVTSNNSPESSDVNKTFSSVFDNLEHVETKKPESTEVSYDYKKKDVREQTRMAEDEAMENGTENVIEEEIDEKVKKKEGKTVTEMLDDYIHLANEALVQVAESLGISPEQLVDAIEKSGISPEDLLTPEGMKALFVELNGLQDPVEIILDEELHNKFKEVMNIIEDTTAEMEGNIDLDALAGTEDFSKVIEKITESKIEKDVTDFITETVQGEAVQEEAVNEVVTDENTDAIENLTTGEMVNPEVKEVTEGNQSQEQSYDDTKYDEAGQSANEGVDVNNAVNNINNPFENVVNNISEAISTSHGYVTAENIVNQITEQIKLTNGNNFSSIELTLNPESLGKVNIQVVAKDGAVTAQIVAETEMAKNAIESHISELKETLSNQNIKVDAVEVTIASYEFNQNSENGSRQEQSQQAGIRRRVALSEFYADEEQVESEEIKMEAEGSTVSYSV